MNDATHFMLILLLFIIYLFSYLDGSYVAKSAIASQLCHHDIIIQLYMHVTAHVQLLRIAIALYTCATFTQLAIYMYRQHSARVYELIIWAVTSCAQLTSYSQLYFLCFHFGWLQFLYSLLANVSWYDGLSGGPIWIGNPVLAIQL